MYRGQWRSIAAVIRNGLRIEPAHTRRSLPRREAADLFARFVEQIEVETTSFCNRTCSFCPNSFIDRRSQRLVMPEATWSAIVAGLAEVRFDGTFVWSRYSEPLSERRILDRIREVRRAAPACRISLNTNGDYLDGGYLDELRDAGVDRVMVDLYMPDDAPATVEHARGHLDRFTQRVGRTGMVTGEEPELVATIADAMEIVIRVRNAATIGQVQVTDRGGLLTIGKGNVRVSPCFLPFKQLVIDWDGSIVPCCQIRSDAAAHADAVVGRIGDGVSLVEAYALLAGWRGALAAYGPKSGPCATCTYAAYEDGAAVRALALLAARPGLPGRPLTRRLLGPWLGKRHTW
jgi:Radical SAM superfamily